MKKKIMKYLWVAIVVVASVVLLQENDVQAAAKWKQAYQNKIESIAAGMYCEYAYVYMDNTKTPVLMVRMNDYRWLYGSMINCSKITFYRYQNGTVKKIGKCTIDERDYISYRRYGKKLVITSGETSIDNTYYVFRLKNGKVKKITYKQEWYGEGAVRYMKGTKEISEKSYKKAIKTNKKLKTYEHFAERLY